MGRINLGAFAGGLAAGYSKGMEDQRKQAEEKRKQDEADREKAYQKEAEGLAATFGSGKQPKAPQAVAANPAAQGIRMGTEQGTPESQTAPVSAPNIAQTGINAASTTQSTVGQDSPIAPATSNTTPAAQPPALGAVVAKTGIASSTEQSKPPSIMETMDLLDKRAAIDLKYGKINGAGVLQLIQARKQLGQEGVDSAVMKFQQQDFQGGLDEFNSVGKFVGAKIVGEPKRSEYEVNGVKMPTTIITLETPDGRRETVNTAAYGAARIKMEKQIELAQNDQKMKNAIILQDMRDTSREMIADKRFVTMLQAAETRSRRGDLGGKQPTHVATAEWLKEKGIAKTDNEAWKMANQLGEAVNEKVTTDRDGNVTIHNPKTGDITRIDSDGKSTVIRSGATQNTTATPTKPAMPRPADATKPRDWSKY